MRREWNVSYLVWRGWHDWCGEQGQSRTRWEHDHDLLDEEAHSDGGQAQGHDGYGRTRSGAGQGEGEACSQPAQRL